MLVGHELLTSPCFFHRKGVILSPKTQNAYIHTHADINQLKLTEVISPHRSHLPFCLYWICVCGVCVCVCVCVCCTVKLHPLSLQALKNKGLKL